VAADDELADEELLDEPPPVPADVAPEPPDPEAAARSVRRRLIGAGVVVAVAIAALGVLYPGRQVPPGAGDYEAGTTDPIQAALPVLRAFVERTRGLSFTGTVDIVVLGGPQFAARQPPPPAATPTELALHLGAPAAMADPGGFYDYARHQLVLRAGPFDAYARSVLVRLLALALDDQRFDVPRLARVAAKNLDRSRAAAALVQGDGTRVQQTYVDTLPAPDQRLVRARLAARSPGGYGGNVGAFPETFGAVFVTELVRSGGNAAVDAAFSSPPPATAQIIEPRLYVQGIAPVGVRPPEAAGPVVDAGTLGRFGLAMLTTRGARVLDAGASGSWQGDAYITYRSGGGYCTRLSVLVEDSAAQTQLRTDLSGAPGLGTLTLFGQDTVRAEFCG
jgi:hypothetical protein